MNKVQLYKEIGLVDDSLIAEAEIAGRKNTHRRTWVKWSAVAACLTLVLAISIFHMLPSSSDFNLRLSSGNVKVNYTDNAPQISQSGDLAYLTEAELFMKYETTIFMGTVEEIRNIEIDFNGSIEYRAIAKIKVDQVYRGDCAEGDTVSVLLPCPVDNGIWVEDTGIVSSMRVGMTGIFMPVRYDETSFRSENGATLYWLDIVEYGFLDGERYAFLETNDGLVFARWAYESISSANSLEEIERYIIEMVK